MPGLQKFDPDNPAHQALRHPDDIKRFGRDPERQSAVKGRKKCSVCGKLPKDMGEHWKSLAGEQFQAHGPVSSNNPNALKNFPGLKKVSEELGGLFNNRRSW